MVKFFKQGRVVIVLGGRMAGKKAVVCKTYDEGSKPRPFGHALVVGLEKSPLKVNKKMGKKKVEKRMQCKPFIKYVNYNHLMPTRYVVGGDVLDTKTLVPDDFQNPEKKKEAKKEIKKTFHEKFMTPPLDKNGKVAKDLVFFRKKLRF
uniref:60S ribosomal protein L27 n=1 Tax=Chromera velia CCMP2878 TaxID=1169474 RepID=A0A0G4HCT6_9ALVE|eukprot:Cvel_26156.t1-p1 / transcript=Cvel_26156.t1 / gene=Cvel_26156 / organism=Chromera_velia_CCMP2878 / gene_product=60S ribosomal protein L27, putative / transcript_product=60S ribosomal protein L27, putative / location=Cvel_scaffold3068:19600-20040(-) / protein_length=147 / sequence_SO=supercontig / SO=protein_coding / is_pseudo=false